jgi:CBS domain-containing protein
MSRANLKRTILRNVFKGASQQGLPNIPVGAIMTRQPFTVSPDCTAEQLVQYFREKKFRHFLVTVAGQLVGVISDRDVLGQFRDTAAVESGQIKTITAAELMSTGLVTVEPTTLLAEAVSRMVDLGINCLPVVDGTETVGILTSTDVFLALEQLLLSTLPTEENVVESWTSMLSDTSV